VVARQAVHDGLVERVAHVQRAGHVGRWQLNGEGGCVSHWGACATEAGHAVAAFFPLGAPMGFKGGGLERFGQALKAGLFDGEGGRVAHGKGFRQKKNGKHQGCRCGRNRRYDILPRVAVAKVLSGTL
jgi:hypothetical protein